MNQAHRRHKEMYRCSSSRIVEIWLVNNSFLLRNVKHLNRNQSLPYFWISANMLTVQLYVDFRKACHAERKYWRRSGLAHMLKYVQVQQIICKGSSSFISYEEEWECSGSA